jgi:hypothetical protein
LAELEQQCTAALEELRSEPDTHGGNDAQPC